MLALAAAPEAAAEGVDLRGWRGEVRTLEEGWRLLPGDADTRWQTEALPGEAVDAAIPGGWRDHQGDLGVATYELSVRFPAAPGEVAFWLKRAGSAWRLYLDGELVMRRGTFSDEPGGPAIDLGPGLGQGRASGQSRLVLQVENVHKRPGGLEFPLYVAEAEAMERWRFRQNLLSLTLLGGMLLMGINHLALWAMRREERTSFWFAALCLVVILRRATYEQYLWQIGLEHLDLLSLRLSIIALALFPAVGLSYLNAAFPTARWTRATRAFRAVTAVVIAPLALLPIDQVTALRALPHLLLLSTIPLAALKATRDLRSRQPGAALFYGGMAPIILGGVHDILAYNELLPWSTRIVPWATLLWFLFQIAALLRRNVSAYRAERDLNATLSRAVEARTAELKQVAAEARAAVDAKARFLANMSHEIRTPMNGVLGTAQLLWETPLSEEQRDHVQTILDSGGVLTAVLNDVLDFSRLEAGRVVLERRPLEPRALAERALRLYRADARRKGLALELSVDPALPTLMGDPIRLQQVLGNLVNNAIKFTAEGRVSVAVGGEARGGGVTLRFAVRDTGIGLSEEERARLFQPFTQANASTTRRFGGTGLGLSICQQFVALMGGEIGVESAPGEGSTFWFTCPMPACDEEEARPELKLTGLPVLVVDDHPVNRRILAAMMRATGAEVTLAADGEQAVALFEERQFWLVLMDCQMPVMDGFEAARRIRALPGGDAAILAVSASALEEDLRRVREAGMDALLTKPVRLEELQRVLAEQLRGADCLAG